MDDDAKAVARQAHANWLAYFRSMHEARLLDARQAVQTALIINGAAATAVLAFLGSVSASASTRHVPRFVVWALASFGIGVFFAACTAVAAYVANHYYAEAIGAKQPIWVHPYTETTESSDFFGKKARRAHIAGYFLIGAALLAFAAGITAAACGFVRVH